MEDIFKLLSEGFDVGQKAIEENDKRIAKVEASLEAYLIRAKETLKQKQLINPKPLKRHMKTIQDEMLEEEEEDDNIPLAAVAEKGTHESADLRPVRTAKSKANQNLKEIPMNAKMRNDNNCVSIKIERSSSSNSSGSLNKATSFESIKENREPEKNQKRKSPDEGIQSATESEAISQRSSKRSNSVEIIRAKIDEIDITNDEEGKMLPPAIPKKTVKKVRAKAKKQQDEEVEPEPKGLRVTRSKIKKEKLSIIDTALSAASLAPEPEANFGISISTTAPVAPDQSVISETSVSKKGKKRYPMPILVKIEQDDKPTRKASSRSNKQSDPKPAETLAPVEKPGDETFNVAPPLINDETFTAGPAMNETVTKNPHDSLMTDDNDEDSQEPSAPPLPPKKHQQPPQPGPKLKKNEVFNPYMSSPVKQKVQAFEKHAHQVATPEKYNTLPSKLGSLRSGTPSRIATFSSSKTTPQQSMTKQMFLSSVTGSCVTSSAPGYKQPKPLKKMNSLSHESLDAQKNLNLGQLLEDKRKQREEKQRQAQVQREALEKDKRDFALKQQQERDDKYRKIMKEKEDKQRMEALKKKILKEKQAKKYAEERAKKDEFIAPKPVEPQSLTKNDSLHLKMQKQLLLDRSLQKKKEESKNTYDFDMLHTDDETDDESKPSKTRPPAPEWSKKTKRKPLIVMQSYINPCILDALFSAKPINVDLKEIFPAIDSKKLVRNSSAIWETPPKHY